METISGPETKEVLERETQSSDRNRSAFADFGKKCKRLIPFLWPKKSLMLQIRVLVCFFILILGRVINVFVPQYNKYIVDSLSLESKVITFRWDYILIYSMFWFLQGQGNSNFLRDVRTFLWIRVEQYTVKEVEMDVFEHLHSLSLKWHLNRKIGEILRIVGRGTASVTDLLKYVIFNIIPTFADIFIAVLYFALVFNIWFGVIVLVTMALYLTVSVFLTEWRTKFKRDTNKLDNEVEAKYVDSLLNFETVKYYNAEKFELENYKTALESFQIAQWKDAASLNLVFEAMNITITIGVLAGTLLCAHYVVDGKLTAGDYVLFITYIVQLYVPLNLFGLYYRLVQIAFVDMENMFTLLGTEPEIVDKTDATSLKVREGSIEFKNVNFSYLPERQILKDISFRIPPGHTAALVTQKSLRQSIGVVPQDTVLFNNTIRYNIGYGRPGASFEEIQEVAKAANIHEQILGFPDGYETVVGERGLKLSGGEKQRIAIARTLLKSPSFVILDEATSSLDTQTERIIQNSLSVVCANKTTLIIAHRLSTIVHADEILVLKEGEIVERGRHEQLLKKNGIYASMWLQQQEPEKNENE